MTRYFHGGAHGLQPGDLIRPAISLGIEHVRTPNQPRYNPRRVYITRLRWYAELFANGHQGDVYEVRPVGRALPDLDARGSFHCSCAEVVAVLATHPVPMPEQAPGRPRQLPGSGRRAHGDGPGRPPVDA